MASKPHKTITLRMGLPLHRLSVLMAADKGGSLNDFILDAVEEEIQRKLDEGWDPGIDRLIADFPAIRADRKLS